MLVSTRPAIPDDLDAVAPVLYSAFKNISDQHGFPPDFDSPEAARNVASLLLNHPKSYGVVAEEAGRLLGSNFIDPRSPVTAQHPGGLGRGGGSDRWRWSPRKPPDRARRSAAASAIVSEKT